MGLETRYRLDEPLLEDLLSLYREAWWSNTRTAAGVRRMLAETDGVVALCDSRTGELVAFCRFLTDGVYKAMIYDVVVRERLRKTGLGRVLMDACLAHPKLRGVRMIELSCKPEIVAFYRKFGFTSEVEGIQLMRRMRTEAM